MLVKRRHLYSFIFSTFLSDDLRRLKWVCMDQVDENEYDWMPMKSNTRLRKDTYP